MRERHGHEHAHQHADASHHDARVAAPGRDVQHEEHDAQADEHFAGDWEEIPESEALQLLATMQPAPSDDTAVAHEADEDLDEDEESEEVEVETEAGEKEAGDEPVIAAKASAAGAGVSDKEAKKNKKKIARSSYITKHEKEMRNYKYEAGTHITNTQSVDFGAPNTYHPEKVKQKYKKKLLSTISVDIGTFVGKNPKTGWVLAFHKTHPKRGGKTVDSGDHTGWVHTSALPGKTAKKQIRKEQRKVRKALASGKGSGHRAKLKKGLHQFAVASPETITKDYQDFPIRGSSADGGTPLGAYTTCDRYGTDVIVGVWNPPGSGDGKERFGGSGGIRAFLPANDQNFRFRLTSVSPVTVWDKSGRYSSRWYYIEARLAGEPVYCWVLQSWTAPSGNGHNFTL